MGRGHRETFGLAVEGRLNWKNGAEYANNDLSFLIFGGVSFAD
jgi:hypothetical protein